MSAEDKLRELRLSLPTVPAPGGNYLPARKVGDVLYLAGVISGDEAGVLAGTVGRECSIGDGHHAARSCALRQLAVLRQQLGSLDNVVAVISVTGYVNCVPQFAETPAVINGFSDLIVAVFGDAGKHVRTAIGVAALPRNAMVEVQMSVQVKSS